MHLSLLTSFITCAAAVVSSAPLESRDATGTVTSTPFVLSLESASNKTLNGSQLFSFHAGAGIEQLGIVKQPLNKTSPAAIFTFNTTSGSTTTGVNVTGVPGKLVWVLQGANFNYSQSLSFTYSPFYNTAVPEFGGTTTVQLSFKDDYLVLPRYTTDRVNPYKAVDNWYACTIPQDQALGYNYFALAWGVGTAAPDNKSCQKVRVKRTFI